MRALAAALTLLAVACTSADSSGEASAERCEASVTEANPVMGPEVRATGPGDQEGWGLIFASWEMAPGEPLALPFGEEVKIVWRLTGEGDPSFQAVGAEGQVHELAWGPDLHAGSNWGRPGQEWGTGWTFPAEGCWVLEVARGADVFTVSANVTADVLTGRS
jgi:hypothetical protein